MITNVQYWNPATGAWQAGPPSLSVGQIGGITGYVHNSSDTTIQRRLDVLVASPDGSTKTSSGDVQVIPPGYIGSWRFTWGCGQAGSYSATLEEYRDDTLTDQWGPGLVATATVEVLSLLDTLMPVITIAIVGLVVVPGILKALGGEGED